MFQRTVGIIALVAVIGAVGCGLESERGSEGADGVPDPQGPASSETALALDSSDILGFETPAGWNVSGGTGTSTSVRTQGSAALAVSNPKQLTLSLASQPVSSTAAALQGLSGEAPNFLVDVLVPAQSGNSSGSAKVSMFVSSRSRKLNSANIGSVSLKGTRPGSYQTVKLPIPKKVKDALSGSFSDLTIQLVVNLPGLMPGAYAFDNLRARDFSGAPVPGAGQSVDLLVQRGGSEPSTDTATFSAGIVQVPGSFHVNKGSAGNGTMQLDLGYGGAPTTSCTYGASSDGKSYVLTSCTGSAQAGDLVGASTATLNMVSAGAGGATVRAQLALNPVGDLAGAGIIPPMPTWWGECVAPSTPDAGNCDPSSASQIVTDYFAQVANNPPYGSTVKTPVGEFAQRHDDGSPWDNLTGVQPPALDPPFDREGHLNKGGDWDAYWRLVGNVASETQANNNQHNTLSASLQARAVAWGKDINVAGIAVEAFTDSGQITTSGFTQQNSGGSLAITVFGITVAGGNQTIPTGGSFNYSPSFSETFDLPPIPIWIFTITIGLNAEVKATFSGNVNPFSIGASLNPEASVGAHIQGTIELGIARGGVSANIDLLKVATPLQARAVTTINTAPPAAPNGCRVGINMGANASLALSTLGGHIDLVAEFGVCPFCYSDSWTLIKWEGVSLASQTLFDLSAFPSVSLPSSLCIVGLDVTIPAPTAGENVPYGIPYSLEGHAVRPPTPNVPETPIACNSSQNGYQGTYMWSTDDGNDEFADPGTGAPGPSTGCYPIISFAKDKSTRTLTLNVTDQFGEAGSTTRNINIVEPLAGPNPFISSVSAWGAPALKDASGVYIVGTTFCGLSPEIHLLGGEFNGKLPVTTNWTVTKIFTGTSVDLGAGMTSTRTNFNGTSVYTEVDWTPTGTSNDIGGDYNVTLTTTDADGITRSKSVTVGIVLNPC